MTSNQSYDAGAYAAELAAEAPITAVAAILSKFEPGQSWDEYLAQADELVAHAEKSLREPRKKRDLIRLASRSANTSSVATMFSCALGEPRKWDQEGREISRFIREHVKGKSITDKRATFARWYGASQIDERWFSDPKLAPVLRDAYLQWRSTETSKARKESALRRKKD